MAERKYIANYTEAYRDEQFRWFEERMDRLPQSLKLSESTSTSDLRRTVQGLMLTLRINKPGVTFSGYLETLLRIREKLEAQGMQ